MSCLYLHIGTPKTGTSSIQYFLGQNKEVLEKKNYCFPDPGYRFDKVAKVRNAHFMVERIYNENHKRMRDKENALRNEGMEKVLGYLDKYDNVILSDESIYLHYNKVKKFWENLTKTLADHGHSLKVITYLRRQDSYIRSFWTQTVKGFDMTLTFADYVEGDGVVRSHAHYLDTLDLITSYVGQENMIVRSFERKQFVGGDLYADFLDCLGLSLTDEFNCADQVRNDTVAGEFVQIKQMLNSNPDFAATKSFILPLIQTATNNRDENADYRRAAMFPDNDPQRFMEQFSEENKIIAQKYMNREDGILFHDSPKSERNLEPYNTEELILACGDLILELKRKLDLEREAKRSLRTQIKLTAALVKNRIKLLFQRKDASTTQVTSDSNS